MAVGLPPPPINDKPGSYTWMEWYRQLRNYVSTSGSVPWYIINFSGSNLTDIANRNHENLQGLQGGDSGQHYHLTAQQYAGVSNSLEVLDTSASISVPTTITLLKPTTTVVANGITYDSSTGEIVFTNGGSYSFNLLLNAKTSATNKQVYFYAEEDTGSGWVPKQYSARQFTIDKSTTEQRVFVSSNRFAAGSKLRLYLWASANTVTLVTEDLPGTPAGTVTLPAIRMMFAGSL